MKKTKKILSLLVATTMVMALLLSGCGKKDKDKEEKKTEAPTESVSEKETEAPTVPAVDDDNFIDLALNVYYNDGELGFAENVAGETLRVTEEGQYTLSFDCSKDLSDAATSKGVNSLKNLTAIYILDMGVAEGKQSPLKAATIKYDKVVVNDTELTITKADPKPAFKSTGVFDTNDPINAWDGSAVEEVESTDDHVANFTTIDNPTTISVTFTLSDFDWDGNAGEGGSEGGESTNTYVNEAKFSDIDFTDMNSVELTKYLGNGINLGNTMEAVNAALGKKSDVSSYETAWGQPVTTKEMIVGMKNCGFDTIRIPVAWANTMDYENGDYTINTAFVDRVQEIVDWAIEAEMFVVLNDHWDGGWWTLFAKEETRDQAWKIHESIWTTVAERFKDYSDMLILESANEELGRAWVSEGLSADEAYKLTTEVNQKFVDIVRASGGNNDDRFLLIAGNATDINLTISDKYVMPKDTVEGKMFISVHYYDPWNYCGDKDVKTEEDVQNYKWGLKEEYDYMESQVAKMKQFTDAGYGVIIGEYGALPAWLDGVSYQLPNTVEYTNFFLDICDVNNFCPVLWSTGNSFNKTTLDMISPEVNKLFTSRCYAEENKKGDDYIKDVMKDIEDAKEAAPSKWPGQEVYEAGTPVAWIMFAGGTHSYSVGDKFNSGDCKGIEATNVVVDGAGTYTVSLDFAGGMDGFQFSALAIADGELLYPGCIIDIKDISIDGNPIEIGNYYTSSDDKKCTRVNLYNGYIDDESVRESALEEDTNIRTVSGDVSEITPMPVNPDSFKGNKLSITFELITK